MAAAILFLPGDFIDLSKSVIATVLFSSNILFWRQSWYFNAQIGLNSAAAYMVIGRRGTVLHSVSSGARCALSPRPN